MKTEDVKPFGESLVASDFPQDLFTSSSFMVSF